VDDVTLRNGSFLGGWREAAGLRCFASGFFRSAAMNV